MDEPPIRDDPRENAVAARRASRRRLVVYALVFLVAMILVLWLTWGFRWPPTAEVVSHLDAVPIFRSHLADAAS